MKEVIHSYQDWNVKNRASGGHGDDPRVIVMTLLSHSMTFFILSPHKFTDVARNLMLMTLSTETSLKSALKKLRFVHL
jgi:hypothetical protein